MVYDEVYVWFIVYTPAEAKYGALYIVSVLSQYKIQCNERYNVIQ